ncbi:hypothetical protein EJ03DRAFT_34932 [Teratosphaeria nubilosa]|uniref:Uncharacterized protein n=1 Tax=Teratosphaeria nubilosa TaxID=161662 RepID=A0A6G1KV69_9PEZI|nr:hypothetical protein EJ03DRAFT_34932 [Teratosphaeria nubilosa]
MRQRTKASSVGNRWSHGSHDQASLNRPLQQLLDSRGGQVWTAKWHWWQERMIVQCSGHSSNPGGLGQEAISGKRMAQRSWRLRICSQRVIFVQELRSSRQPMTASAGEAFFFRHIARAQRGGGTGAGIDIVGTDQASCAASSSNWIEGTRRLS